MKAVVKGFEDEYVICKREDGIIINILLKFMHRVEKGEIITLPDIKNINLN
ncbi:hypothetical protein [Clostridium rectalis]|uniref:hypothetical protein n=1 Tax=Clostridium rectalis TaxID=2040295 RepID=UPI0013DE01C8|nr:hypothetical protein [Clostridium rectalis]